VLVRVLNEPHIPITLFILRYFAKTKKINILTWTRKTDVKSGFYQENQSQNTGKYEDFGTLEKAFRSRNREKRKRSGELPKYKSNFNETSTRGEKILGGMADGWSRISELFFAG
jgi:hypothetical protein